MFDFPWNLLVAAACALAGGLLALVEYLGSTTPMNSNDRKPYDGDEE